MSLFGQILGGPVERKTIDASALTWNALFGSTTSKAGVSVNANTALRVSTVLACTKVVTEDVAKVPFKLFREQGRKKQVAMQHHLYRVLARRPNDWQTPYEFKETLGTHAVLTGNGYAFNSTNSRGETLELIPLVPYSVRPVQDSTTRAVTYEVSLPDGEFLRLPRRKVVHLRGISWNGYAGLDAVQLAREAIGLSIATEEAQARLHQNGARPAGVLVSEGELKKEQLLKIKDMWDAAHGSLEKWGGTAVLDRGLKYTQLSLSGVDAQTLESRKFQVEEICRAFRVNPLKVMYSDKTATYASVEQFAIAHVLDTIMPWAVRWEEVLERDLLSDEEWAAGYFVKVMLQGLLRGDAKSRSEFYKSGINDGWMTRNEARALEELDALDGLDDPLVPLNMRTLGDDEEPTDGTAPALPGDGTVVQDTALNGAQVASLLAIVQAVAAGQLPADTARAMIRAAFPEVDESTIDAMLNGLDGFTPPAPPAPPSAAPKPPE